MSDQEPAAVQKESEDNSVKVNKKEQNYNDDGNRCEEGEDKDSEDEDGINLGKDKIEMAKTENDWWYLGVKPNPRPTHLPRPGRKRSFDRL